VDAGSPLEISTRRQEAKWGKGKCAGMSVIRGKDDKANSLFIKVRISSFEQNFLCKKNTNVFLPKEQELMRDLNKQSISNNL
jgi:hypothetical protein